MDIFLFILTSLVLAALLAFNYRPDKSRFEINRLAAHNREFRVMARFLDIYLGLRNFLHLLALADAIVLVIVAWRAWGMGGGLMAFGAIMLAWLIARMSHRIIARAVGQHMAWFNKYFAWTKVLGELIVAGDELRISSLHELLHIIDRDDFLSSEQKSLAKASLEFGDKLVSDVMTPRDQIIFVRDRDTLGPKLMDELHQSGHAVFPVVRANLDHVVGVLYLDDALPLPQKDRSASDVMRKTVSTIDQSANLVSAVEHMSRHHAGQILVTNSADKVVGLIAPSDVIGELFETKRDE
jgi:CBS domain containing-hemolysin-like protein